MSSIPKFFVRKENINENIIKITGSDALHISRVLRMKQGDIIKISDMQRTEYTAKIISSGNDEVVSSVISSSPSDTESPFHITLFQAVPKADKLDFTVQKAVELGAAEIVLVNSERCVSKPDKKAADAKIERLNRIAKSAAMQSGRGILPTVSGIISFDEAVQRIKCASLGFMCYEGENVLKLRDLLSSKESIESVSFFIGPEGGISKAETEKAKSANIPSVTLGKRILRTETAGICVLSAISCILE